MHELLAPKLNDDNERYHDDNDIFAGRALRIIMGDSRAAPPSFDRHRLTSCGQPGTCARPHARTHKHTRARARARTHTEWQGVTNLVWALGHSKSRAKVQHRSEGGGGGGGPERGRGAETARDGETRPFPASRTTARHEETVWLLEFRIFHHARGRDSKTRRDEIFPCCACRTRRAFHRGQIRASRVRILTCGAGPLPGAAPGL